MAKDFRFNRSELLAIKVGDANGEVLDLSTIKISDVNDDTEHLRFGQDIFDISIAKNGTIETIFDDILKYNKTSLSLNTELNTGDLIYVNTENTGVFAVKKYLKNLNFVVVNNDQVQGIESKGDYNNDFNNDFL